MTPLFTPNQEMFFGVLTMVFMASVIGDFTCRYYLPSLTNSYAQLTNVFLIGSQNNLGGETVLHTNAQWYYERLNAVKKDNTLFDLNKKLNGIDAIS